MEKYQECERCGRRDSYKGVKIKEGVTGEMLCQYCRASDSRHISGIRSMGYTPTVNGEPINE
jgi:hypothetical protein